MILKMLKPISKDALAHAVQHVVECESPQMAAIRPQAADTDAVTTALVALDAAAALRACC
jgi:hypothetical protein